MKQLFPLIFLPKISSPVAGQALSDSNTNWSYHFQLTAINQTHPGFEDSYYDANNLINKAYSKNCH